MNEDYFIGGDVAILSNKTELKDGVRIFCIRYNVLRVELGEGFEGPYPTLQNLKANSELFRKLQKENSRRAEKISRSENIVKCHINESIFSSANQGHHKDFLQTIRHVITGDIHKEELRGVHLFDESCMRIICVTRTPDKLGVWEAEIEMYDNKSNKYIRKEKPTTFFPNEWSRSQLFHEISAACNNIYKCPECENIWHGITPSGIFLNIVVKNDRIETVYPRHSDN